MEYFAVTTHEVTSEFEVIASSALDVLSAGSRWYCDMEIEKTSVNSDYHLT